MNSLVTAQGVTKRYGDFRAVDDVSFDIEKGRILGLIGPNGAGKTTLLKAILGLTECEGQLSVLGLDPFRQRKALMQQICFIADVAVLPRIDRHDDRQVKLSHHALGEFADLRVLLDLGLRQVLLGTRSREVRMRRFDEVEQLRHPDPARQHRDVRDEADLLHERFALFEWIEAEYGKLALAFGEAEDGLE